MLIRQLGSLPAIRNPFAYNSMDDGNFILPGSANSATESFFGALPTIAGESMGAVQALFDSLKDGQTMKFQTSVGPEYAGAYFSNIYNSQTHVASAYYIGPKQPLAHHIISPEATLGQYVGVVGLVGVIAMTIYTGGFTMSTMSTGAFTAMAAHDDVVAVATDFVSASQYLQGDAAGAILQDGAGAATAVAQAAFPNPTSQTNETWTLPGQTTGTTFTGTDTGFWGSGDKFSNSGGTHFIPFYDQGNAQPVFPPAVHTHIL